MASAGEVYNSATSLTIFNLPYSLRESEIHSMFPAAQYVNLLRQQNDPSRSKGICVLQFNNSRDCQEAYDECQDGMEVQGRMLRADFGSGSDSGYRNQRGGGGGGRIGRGYQHSRPRSDQQEYGGGRNNDRTLTVSNLPYAATERDIRQEFPSASRVVLNLTEEGLSRGVAQVTFNDPEDCQAAMNECNYKTMSGRPMRARMARDGDNSTQRYDQDNRYGGGRQMNYAPRRGGDRPNRFGSGDRGGGPGRWAPRDYGRNGGGGMQMQSRRDRSPPQGRNAAEPIRGYGDMKGPRITSAVIRQQQQAGGYSSPSGSSSGAD